MCRLRCLIQKLDTANSSSWSTDITLTYWLNENFLTSELKLSSGIVLFKMCIFAVFCLASCTDLQLTFSIYMQVIIQLTKATLKTQTRCGKKLVN